MSNKKKNIVRDLNEDDWLRFKIALENAPNLKPQLFATFAPNALWSSTVEKMCRHDILAKINAATLNLSKLVGQDLYPLVVFRGEEDNPEDPRLHAHWTIFGERKIDPEDAYACFPGRWREKKRKKDPQGRTREELLWLYDQLLNPEKNITNLRQPRSKIVGKRTSITRLTHEDRSAELKNISKWIKKLDSKYVCSGKLEFKEYDDGKAGLVYHFKFHFPLKNSRGVFFHKGRNARRERRYRSFYSHIENIFRDYSITAVD